MTAAPNSEWTKDKLSVHLYQKQNLPVLTADFDIYLYLTPAHLATQTLSEIYHFALFRNKEPHAAAIFQCTCDTDKNWISPPRAPFGGIQCDEKCNAEEINFLLQCIEKFIMSHEPKKIIISTASSYYNLTMSNLLTSCYYTNGYKILKNHLNYCIPVTSAIYADQIHHSEKRRLKKCKSAGFESEIYPNPNIGFIYTFLQRCRIERGYNISLTISQLEALFINFPQKIQVFTVKDLNQVVALTVTIRVNESILYNFLSASLTDYNRYSPAVLLTETVYDFCQAQKISILDLGISLDHLGNEKAGLLRFKENIGGVSSYKTTYEKIPVY